MDGNGEAFCKWCQKPLRAQKAALRKHASTVIHQNKAKTHNSRLVKKISGLGNINFVYLILFMKNVYTFAFSRKAL